jgi:hypothetical protein
MNDIRRFMHAAAIVSEGVRKIGRSPIFWNPSRNDFLTVMRRLRKKHDLSEDDIVLRGFVDLSENVLLFDAWHHTHDDALEEIGDDIGGVLALRLNFWSEDAVVGISSDRYADTVEKNQNIIKMMGGSFSTEVAY